MFEDAPTAKNAEMLQFHAPSLTGRYVSLRPVATSDIPFLYQLELNPLSGARWRFRGQTPSPEQFARSLWEGVLATFLVEAHKPARQIGVVTVYGADLIAGHANIAAASLPDARDTGQMIEAIGLLLEYTFVTWPFRKLYAECLEFNLQQYASALRWLFEEEGRLRDYEYYDNRLWDKYVISVSRGQWQRYRDFVVSEPGVRSSDLPEVASVDELCVLLCTILERKPGAIEFDTSFAHLDLDSLEWFALGAVIEDLAGARIPDGLFRQLVNPDDAYLWIGQRRHERAPR